MDAAQPSRSVAIPCSGAAMNNQSLVTNMECCQAEVSDVTSLTNLLSQPQGSSAIAQHELFIVEKEGRLELCFTVPHQSADNKFHSATPSLSMMDVPTMSMSQCSQPQRSDASVVPAAEPVTVQTQQIQLHLPPAENKYDSDSQRGIAQNSSTLQQEGTYLIPVVAVQNADGDVEFQMVSEPCGNELYIQVPASNLAALQEMGLPISSAVSQNSFGSGGMLYCDFVNLIVVQPWAESEILLLIYIISMYSYRTTV